MMLFADQSKLMGTFKGSTDKNLEFSAEIVTEYNENMLDTPQLGQFLLIELAHEEEASLGRITRFVPSGLLASTEGEDYLNAMQKRHQPVDEKLKNQYLKYRVQVKLLGAVKVKEGKIIYVPSQRRLPHLGAKVTLPSDKVLESLCGLSQGKTSLGHYVLGEFVFCGNSIQQDNPALRSMNPELKVTFDINHLVSKRSLIFARAGYGKSNLMKYLMTELYKKVDPKTESGMPVGTLIFDPDGEYFWADKVRGRPGLCDVPHLKDKIMVFTNRKPFNSHYGSWKVGEVKLDIRDLLAREVISIAVAAHRQGDQNVLKLKAMSKENWRKMVDLLQTEGLQASDEKVGELLGYNKNQILNSLAEIGAARSNMYGVVKALHDPESKLLSGTIGGLKQGKIVVVDISLLSSAGGNILAGLLLRYLFNYNQENFTGGENIIPVIVVIEEAQSVLGKNLDDTSPFVEWVKEGRKYDLGAILITQQPGSMAPEIMSQADNWFCFHLLSEGDARTLGKYNAHYSEDILAHLIGEPITGNCYMWSVPHQPFVLPVRVSSFEDLYKKNVKLDSSEKAIKVAAQEIKREVSESLNRLKEALLEAFRNQRTQNASVIKFIERDGDLLGVKSGQLFYVIRDIKLPSDTQSEDSLKDTLFGLIFGEGNYQKLGTGNDVYYCATKKQWKKVLGKLPNCKSP